MRRASSRALHLPPVWLWGLLLLAAGGVHAEALVLVHGYLGSGNDWRGPGFVAALERAGWSDGGHLRSEYGIVQARHSPARVSAMEFFTLDLPYEAPLLTQSEALADYLRFIEKRHPEESLVLAGFSAGGVVARLFLVRHPDAPVRALITIASPHLGTESADLALVASESPLGALAPLFGADTLNRSQRLYADLARERPGTLLYWLNHQPHPDAEYISVVRTNASTELGDLVVPADSQDMNNVAALHGRVTTLRVPGRHGVETEDGELLARLLEDMRRL